jgi:hypothetical protein
MEFYHKGVTDSYPSGLAWLIVKALHARFKPQDAISTYEFSRALWSIKMQPKDSPDVMFSRIASLKSYYGVHDYDEQQLIAVVSNAVPTEYKVIIAVEERRHRKPLTFDQVETCLMSYWRRVYGEFGPQDHKKNSQVTFSAVASTPKTNPRFRCFNCGKPGHSIKDCPRGKKGKGARKKTDSKCGRCGRVGHATSSCWHDPDNASKRPAWLQEKIKKAGTGESSNVMADEKFEVLFVCCEIESPELNMQLFPKVLRLLSDPNIWIGDTGASVDMTPYPEGLIDTHPSDISVHVGNNSYTPATLCGKLPVIVCDNSGVEQYGASFSDMHLVPQAPYNIISTNAHLEIF